MLTAGSAPIASPAISIRRHARGLEPMLCSHWGLRRDPFGEVGVGYVSTPTHDEAVARILHAVEAGERRVTLTASTGLGKTTVLAAALKRLHLPRRRIARVVAPLDGTSLLAELAGGLGMATGRLADRANAWRTLSDAAKLCRLQGLSVLIAVEDAHWLTEPADRDDLDRLSALDRHPSARLSVVRVGCPPDDESSGLGRRPLGPRDPVASPDSNRNRIVCAAETRQRGSNRADVHLPGHYTVAWAGVRRAPRDRPARLAEPGGRRPERSRDDRIGDLGRRGGRMWRVGDGVLKRRLPHQGSSRNLVRIGITPGHPNRGGRGSNHRVTMTRAIDEPANARREDALVR